MAQKGRIEQYDIVSKEALDSIDLMGKGMLMSLDLMDKIIVKNKQMAASQSGKSSDTDITKAMKEQANYRQKR